VTSDVPGRKLDFEDLRPGFGQQLAAKRSGVSRHMLQDADTGERQVGDGHGHASRATNEKLVEASGTAEKVFPALNLASDRFGTREIQLTHGIAYHLLCDRRRRLATGLAWDSTLREEELREQISQRHDEGQEE
jgi:hypothetical protein